MTTDAALRSYALEPNHDARQQVQAPMGTLVLLLVVALWRGGYMTTWLFLLMLPGGLVPIWAALRVPYRIDTYQDGRVHFRGWLRRTTVHADDIEAIESNLLIARPGYARIRCAYRRDNVYLSVHFDGWNEFLAWLEHTSPGTRLRGV